MEHLKSSSKIFAVLETLCMNGDLGISELSRRLRLGKSSVHRFISILKQLGYVSKNENNKKYSATLKLFEIGAMVRGRNRLVNIARPYMEELGDRFHETINLGLLDGNEVVYVDKVESIHTLRIDLAIGRRVPSYCTALGKIFLAYLPEKDLERYCGEAHFEAMTQKTITSRTELVKNLNLVRKEGIAVDDRELDHQIRCIAAPIRDNSGGVIAALSIAGPTTRLTIERLKSFKRPLIEATRKISQKLGYFQVLNGNSG
jgi:IclR family KDG regulon transcriptional repressor